MTGIDQRVMLSYPSAVTPVSMHDRNYGRCMD